LAPSETDDVLIWLITCFIEKKNVWK